METYYLLPIIPGYVWSGLMFLLTLVRNKTQVSRRKSPEEQLEVEEQVEMEPSLQVSPEN